MILKDKSIPSFFIKDKYNLYVGATLPPMCAPDAKADGGLYVAAKHNVLSGMFVLLALRKT